MLAQSALLFKYSKHGQSECGTKVSKKIIAMISTIDVHQEITDSVIRFQIIIKVIIPLYYSQL
jgi:hypothetical protein